VPTPAVWANAGEAIGQLFGDAVLNGQGEIRGAATVV
jgi:hypothetical protein